MKRVLPPLLVLLLAGQTTAAGTWSLPGMDVEERPRVLWGPGQDEAIRQRLAAEPYASIYLRVVGIAGRNHDLEDHSESAEQLKANSAQAAAFVYAMNRNAREEGGTVIVEAFGSPAERDAHGQRAEELLNHSVETCRMVDYSTGTKDIHCAQELTMYATAYDILAGAGYPFADEQSIRDRLATFTADFFYKWTVAYWTTLNRSANQNHGSKTSAAIGLAAIVLNGYDRQMGDELDGYRDPIDWIEFGMTFTDALGLDALVNIDGGYGEGPVYYRYAAINLAVFYWAWHRYTRGGTLTVEGIDYPDPWGHPYLLDVLDWLLAIRMPDGTFPPIDDGTPGVSFFWGPFVGFPNGSHYRWAWENGIAPHDTSGSIDQGLLTLVAFDDAILPAAPGFGPSIFMPEGGQAVFRSGWQEDDVYLIVQAEHGVAAGWGFRADGEWLEGAGGHEHSDPGTTHLMAFGERLLIDCGYLGWENHEKVREPEDHNLVLVDGKGPQSPQLSIPPFTIVDGQVIIEDPAREGGWIPGEDADAHMVQAFSSDGFEHIRVDSRYHVMAPPADLKRRVVFVNRRYFVQTDQAIADDGDSHTFELLSHLNAGGTSGGDYQEVQGLGARVVRDGAELDLFLASPSQQPTLTTSLGIHDAWRWREETHTVLHAAVEGSAGGFLTILYPKEAGSPSAQIECHASSGGLAAFSVETPENRELIALAAPESGPHTVDGLTFDGSLAIASAPAGNPTERLLLGDGTSLESGTRRATLEIPGTLAVAWQADLISGHYSGPANRLGLSGSAGTWGGSGFCSIEVQGDMLMLELPGDGPFEIELGASAANQPPVASISAPDKGRVGQPVMLDGSSSCDPDGDQLTHAWTIDAPVRTTVDSLPSLPEVEFVPQWPGPHRFGLRVSDGQANSLETRVLVWVERAEQQPGDGGPGDGGLDGDAGADGDHSGATGGGCGCATRPGPSGLAVLFAGLLWMLALAVSRRRG